MILAVIAAACIGIIVGATLVHVSQESGYVELLRRRDEQIADLRATIAALRPGPGLTPIGDAVLVDLFCDRLDALDESAETFGGAV